MSFNSLDISASALHAQRIRMDAISSNLANVNTTRNADGTIGAYKRKEVVFSTVYNQALGNDSDANSAMGAMGLDGNVLKGEISNNGTSISNGVNVSQIVDDKTPFRKEYNPSHPDADKDGYVTLPNINMVTEMVDMISASRAYEANVTSMETTKTMMSSALKI